MAIWLFASTANAALIISDTESLGVIGDADTSPGVSFTFDFGTTFSSITSLLFTFEPCDFCSNTIGSAEDVVFDLGPDSFLLSNVGLRNTIVSSLSFSPALEADLLDGVVSGNIWLREQAGFNFAAGISSADISLQVEGVAATVPEPGSFLLLALGLAGVGFSRKMKAA